jgi:hypothetical protein
MVSTQLHTPATLQSLLSYVRFEVFTAAPMKNDVFWDVTPCGSCKNQRFGEISASFTKVTRIGELGTTLAVTAQSRDSSEVGTAGRGPWAGRPRLYSRQ